MTTLSKKGIYEMSEVRIHIIVKIRCALKLSARNIATKAENVKIVLI